MGSQTAMTRLFSGFRIGNQRAAKGHESKRQGARRSRPSMEWDRSSMASAINLPVIMERLIPIIPCPVATSRLLCLHDLPIRCLLANEAKPDPRLTVRKIFLFKSRKVARNRRTIPLKREELIDSSCPFVVSPKRRVMGGLRQLVLLQIERH